LQCRIDKKTKISFDSTRLSVINLRL